MPPNTPKKLLQAAAIAVAACLLMRYLFPLFLPFLLGIGLAVAAEPTVKLLNSKARLPRGLSTAVSVSAVCIMVSSALTFLLAILVRQLRGLHNIFPQIEASVRQGLQALQACLITLSNRLPEAVGSVVKGILDTMFSGSEGILKQAATNLPHMAGGLLSGASEGMLTLVTGVISGFMISARLPEIRRWLRLRIPQRWLQTYRPATQAVRKALWGWLQAELKLAGIAWVLLSSGFFLLKISNPLLLACAITLVDAFPVLGVGTVMLPWSLICLLQGNIARCVGLLGLYGVIWLVRSILEPKLIGKGIGLDPLLTLGATYIGLQLWGVAGMLLAPVLALAIQQIAKQLWQ